MLSDLRLQHLCILLLCSCHVWLKPRVSVSRFHLEEERTRETVHSWCLKAKLWRWHSGLPSWLRGWPRAQPLVTRPRLTAGEAGTGSCVSNHDSLSEGKKEAGAQLSVRVTPGACR